MKVVKDNYKKLQSEGVILNKKLMSCVMDTSVKYWKNEDFEKNVPQCFDKYKLKVSQVYDSMYKIIL